MHVHHSLFYNLIVETLRSYSIHVCLENIKLHTENMHSSWRIKSIPINIHNVPVHWTSSRIIYRHVKLTHSERGENMKQFQTDHRKSSLSNVVSIQAEWLSQPQKNILNLNIIQLTPALGFNRFWEHYKNHGDTCSRFSHPVQSWVQCLSLCV